MNDKISNYNNSNLLLKIELLKAQISKCEIERDNIILTSKILKKRHKEASTIAKLTIKNIINKAWQDYLIIEDQRKYLKEKNIQLRQLELNNQVRHLMSSIHQSVKKV